MTSLLDNATAAGVASGVLTAWWVLIEVRKVRWEARVERRAELYRLKAEQEDRSRYKQRQTGGLYRLKGALDLEDRVGSGRGVRLAERAVRVAVLPDAERDAAVEIAERWARGAGAFARHAARQHKLPLRSFLQTNHLALIRDGALAEPFLVWRAAATAAPPIVEVHEHGEPLNHIDLVPWALALRDLARRYNAVARQQREPVTFTHRHGEQPLAVLGSPSPALRPLLNAVDRLTPRFRLRAHRRWLARRRFERAVADVRARLARLEDMA